MLVFVDPCVVKKLLCYQYKETDTSNIGTTKSETDSQRCMPRYEIRMLTFKATETVLQEHSYLLCNYNIITIAQNSRLLAMFCCTD